MCVLLLTRPLLLAIACPAQKMALKMADDSGLEGGGKRKRHSGLNVDELQAMRERSMSVQVGDKGGSWVWAACSPTPCGPAG